MITKTEGAENFPAKSYLVVVHPEKPSTWHLRFADEQGKPDVKQMGQAWAALMSNYRGEPYKGPKKTEALAKLRKIYAAIGRPTPDEVRKEWTEAWSGLPAFKEMPWPEKNAFQWITNAADAQAFKADESAQHIKIGKSLSASGVEPAVDLYGVHAEEHGSAWKAPKANFAALQKTLWGMGYRPKGKGHFWRGNVLIDVGQDDKNLYLYIRDDFSPSEKLS